MGLDRQKRQGAIDSSPAGAKIKAGHGQSLGFNSQKGVDLLCHPAVKDGGLKYLIFYF